MNCYPFKSWCLQNFPFIEDDLKALDNYTLMCKLYEYIKNVASDVSKLNTEYNTLITEFQKLYDYVNEYLTGIEDIKEAIIIINNRLDELAERTLANQSRIEQVNSNLINLVNSNFQTLKAYVDSQDALLDEKIENLQIGAIQLYDPTSGTIQPLQIVINNLYGIGNKDGLTATEFDALDLTATSFDAYQITAYEFDSSGKVILV